MNTVFFYSRNNGYLGSIFLKMQITGHQCYKVTFEKYKTLSLPIYSYIKHEEKLKKKQEIVRKHDAHTSGSVFGQFRVFPISTSVDIHVNVQQTEKMFLSIYDNAQCM